MKYLLYGHQASVSLARALLSWLVESVAAEPSPTDQRPHLSRRRRRTRVSAGHVLLVLGLAMQLVLLFLVGEVIDLYVSAVELWAELARKHLEITL